MSITYVDGPDSGTALTFRLQQATSVAVDCEAAGFHRYSDKLCLVQLSIEEDTYIVDPLALDAGPILSGALQDPAVPVLMHGAPYDMRLLHRDLGIQVSNVYDTQVAASLSGQPGVGLQALLDALLDVQVSKKFQRADWAERPLTPEMVEYAANDTRYLHDLAGKLDEELDSKGRRAWAREEFSLLECIPMGTDDAEPVDPVTRVKGARDLDPLQVTLLREAIAWRDDIARSMDRAPFRVAPDSALLLVATEAPDSIEALADLKGMSPRLVKSRGGALLARIRRVQSLPEDQLEGYPQLPRGPGRPAPEVETRFERLKTARNTVAETLELDRGRVLPNHVLMAIAHRNPTDLGSLGDTPDLRRWQLEVLGEALLAAVSTADGNS